MFILIIIIVLKTVLQEYKFDVILDLVFIILTPFLKIIIVNS